MLVQPCAATPFQWEYTGSLNIGRRDQSGIAIQLLNGKVLAEGGGIFEGDRVIDTPTAELYDPSTGTWTFTGSLNNARFLHTATRLPDGKVLVAAGADISGGFYFPIASAELYDPATGTWNVTGSLNTARLGHTATSAAQRQGACSGWSEQRWPRERGDSTIQRPVIGLIPAASQWAWARVPHSDLAAQRDGVGGRRSGCQQPPFRQRGRLQSGDREPGV